MSGTPPSDSPSTFADGVRLAIGTLSVFPVRPGVVDRRAAGTAMTIAPFVGVLIGAAGGMVLTAALWLGITPLLASVLAVGTLALLTRGLHLDGLADLADGLGSGKPAEQALDIMKRSDIGPFGVVTLIFTLLVQVAALSELTAAGTGPVALVTACAAGRLALAWACRAGIPPARPGGLGAMVAGTVRRGAALAVTALVLIGVTALAFLSRLVTLDSLISAVFPGLSSEYGVFAYAPPPSEAGPGLTLMSNEAYESSRTLTARFCRSTPAVLASSLAVLVGLLAAWAVRRRAVRRLGGITGDVLGALVEIATAAALVACAVAVG
ncbi:adenosylcobinamide-GDP ribazoletransferase [Streptosporangium sp. NPDC000396]|uniref:adenosylcobinamide-GDP ribazoletransferase n=1 Tax=Streptosporangium sp. NPDC000396 TaxID=3366185 RepID=UPI0036B90D33